MNEDEYLERFYNMQCQIVNLQEHVKHLYELINLLKSENTILKFLSNKSNEEEGD